MDDELSAYLEAIGAPDALVQRINDLLEMYGALLSDEIVTTFVSEYETEGEERRFESLWLFSASFAMEAQLLGTDEDQFDFVPIDKNVRHVVVRKRNYNFGESTSASRLLIEAWFGGQLYGAMRATGHNCGRLSSVLQEHLLPNTAPEARSHVPA